MPCKLVLRFQVARSPSQRDVYCNRTPAICLHLWRTVEPLLWRACPQHPDPACCPDTALHGHLYAEDCKVSGLEGSACGACTSPLRTEPCLPAWMYTPGTTCALGPGRSARRWPVWRK